MKIIYLEEKEVKMGDKVSLNGVEVTVTQQLIDDLPNLFKVEEEQEAQIVPEYVKCIKDTGVYRGAKCGEILKSWYSPDKSFPYRFESKYGENGYMNSESFYTFFKPSTKEAWLLQEAKRRYPKGTKFKNPSTGKICVASGIYNFWPYRRNSIENVTEEGLPYCDGQWAEIAKPLFTTEDGVEIYEGDKCWFLLNEDITSGKEFSDIHYDKWVGSDKEKGKYFSTREAAEEYIAKHKEKTLEDYEKELLTDSKIYRNKADMWTYPTDIYRWLRENEPKLYWSKVLQLIADDLNEGKCVNRIFIKRHGGDYIPVFDKESLRGTPMFASKSDAMKAIKIMGDKLDLIYKH
jgi:hypothetical protein